MEPIATREILWNVNSIWTYIGMYGLMVLSIAVAANGVVQRIKLWRAGPSAPESAISWREGLGNLLAWAAFQRGVVRERVAGVMHTLIYLGFLVLLFTTTMVFIHHDLGIEIYQGPFYLWVTLCADIFGFLFLIGLAMGFHRRFIAGEDKLHSQNADTTLLSILALLIVQGFLLEGLRIHVTHDPWATWSPIGLLVAKLFWALPEEPARWLHWVTWWFHTVTVFAAMAFVPYSKFFHIVASTANLYFRTSPRPKGALPFPGDLEEKMEREGDSFSIGLGAITSYNWKHRLDLDACTSCGRCQDVCPAYLSGKPLSPKWVILDSRNHMLSLHASGALPTATSSPSFWISVDRILTKLFLRNSGIGELFTGRRGGNDMVQQHSLIRYGGSVDARLAGEVMHEDVFWSCTTCMACVAACPVGIHHVDQIVENRRHLALMQGAVPKEAQATLRALENRSNPYGAPEDRSNWLSGLDVPVLKPGDSVDYLYWVGCVSAFDPRKQKIAKALVTIMRQAGLSFGVLGNAEGCSGDPARRLGEENLFQMLAKANIATLENVTFKTMVANCPHCFNSLKNEYPQLGNREDGRSPEIIHHSVLLKKLLAEERIILREGAGEFTFHDPCYLGRYNDEYDAPREALQAVKGLRILEMDKSREKGMCCGAGGGHFWMDMKIGTRVNALRADQAAATGASHIATACPFCLQMMEDGVKLTGREGSMTVKDIAEVIVENLETNPSSSIARH